MLPEPVDKDPRRERVLTGHEPVGQLQPTLCPPSPRPAGEKVGCRGNRHWCRLVLPVAARDDAHRERRFCLLGHHHRRTASSVARYLGLDVFGFGKSGRIGCRRHQIVPRRECLFREHEAIGIAWHQRRCAQAEAGEVTAGKRDAQARALSQCERAIEPIDRRLGRTALRRSQLPAPVHP